MQKHRALTLGRFAGFRRQIEKSLYPETAPVALFAYAAPDRIGYREAMDGDYTPIAPGHRFGPAWSTHWVRVEAGIPETWAGREVHLLWDSSSEACVWEDGEPRQGLSDGHRTDYLLTRSAKAGKRRILHVEVACNQLFGVSDPDDITIKKDNSGIGLLRRAEIGVFHRGAWDLLWDFVVVSEMAAELPEDSPRAGQALLVANEMVNLCDLDDPSTWPAARDAARHFLADKNGDGAHELSAIGHAHIDTAWLWPLAETRRKCYRSFSSALRYMVDYPGYRFVCSQAQQWTWMKETCPALYRQMVDRAGAGRFIPVGGTWVEPDCNIPSGESLVRQFLYGQRFFKEELGARSRVFWNPDVFGYSAQLPQIMAGSGIQYFLTQKLSWNQFNKLPSHTFYWEGLDGTRVLTHFPPADTYNGTCRVGEILQNVRNYKDHEKSRESYYLFGYGDGGGGPTPEMLERLERCHDVDGLPRIEQRSPEEFFTRLEAGLKDPAIWVGELYFELHRGTYTTHARNKRFNRQCEFLLRDIEALWALAAPGPYPRAELNHLWKLVLLNQFHDIIPGSSINEVYRDSDRHYSEVRESGNTLLHRPLDALAGPAGGDKVLTVNTLGQPRREVVELPDGLPGTQVSDGGRALAVIYAPAFGYAVTQADDETRSVSVAESEQGVCLENDFVRVVFRQDGRLVSLYDRQGDRELVPEGETGNHLVLFDDHPVYWEAWDVDAFHLEKHWDVASAGSLQLIEEGPLRAAIRVEYKIGSRSRLTQTIRLSALGPRLDFLCEAEWHESRRFLKVEFPWDLRAMQATYEVQFGHLQRPTHFNTSWDMARFEVCGHRWADLYEPGYGVTLMNDCKYGYSTQGHTMRLSLLRAPKSPDPEADMGRHRFVYAVYPHRGTLQEANMVHEALCFNVPMHLAPTRAAPAVHTWLEIDDPALVIDTVKRAEDSDHLVVRMYESHGKRGKARLTSALPVTSASLCNLLEEDLEGLTWQDGGVEIAYTPFRIITLKLNVETS